MLEISMNLIFKMILIFKRTKYALLAAIIMACTPQLTPLNTAETIVVDGEDTEWNRDQYQMVSGLGLIYSVAQEEQHTKILIKAMDRQTIKKIGLLGLTVWLDGTGKSKKEVGIKYPLGAMENGLLEKIISQGGSLQNFDLERLEEKGKDVMKRQDTNSVGLTGLLDNTDEMHHVSLKQLKIPIEISLKIVSRQKLIIEYANPNSILKNGKKNVLAVGFEIEGINTQELIQKQMAARGGGSFGSAAGRRMAGRAMAARSEKLREFQELNLSVMAWSKFSLND